jgi:hypothetical protein
MISTPLYLRDGTPVGVDVLLPPSLIPFEVVVWGTRIFVRSLDGQYHEGCLYTAYTEKEWNAILTRHQEQP